MANPTKAKVMPTSAIRRPGGTTHHHSPLRTAPPVRASCRICPQVTIRRVAEAEQAHRGLVDDRPGHVERHRGEGVGHEQRHHVPEDDPPAARTDGPGGLDVGLLLDLEGHRVDGLHGPGPEVDAHDAHEVPDVQLEHRREDDQHGQQRHVDDDLEDALDDDLDPAPVVRAGDAGDHAHGHRDEGGEESDQQRPLHPGHDAGPQVALGVVGAEQARDLARDDEMGIVGRPVVATAASS